MRHFWEIGDPERSDSRGCEILAREDVYNRPFVIKTNWMDEPECYAKALEQVKDRLVADMYADFQKVERPLKTRLESASTIAAIVDAFQDWLRSFDQDVYTYDLFWIISTNYELAGLVQGFLDTNATT